MLTRLPVETAADQLLRFNCQVLAQALEVVRAHERPGSPAYHRPVGAHLRHVIEHFDALLMPPVDGRVDYDLRPRDARLERDPALASRRLQELSARLAALAGSSLERTLCVRGVGGTGGDFDFEVTSTLGRELVFVAGHAIHHFALLAPHCRQLGITLADAFGVAPATVVHARSVTASTGA